MIRELTIDHLESAVDLVLSAYDEERDWLPMLPNPSDLSSIVKPKMHRMILQKRVFGALAQGKLVGLLGGYPVEALFGAVPGIYCPLYGHAVRKDQRGSIQSDLYLSAAHHWVQEGFLSHALTLYAQDQLSVQNWFWFGFGLRCVDSVRTVEPISTSPSIPIQKAELDDIPTLRHIHRSHTQYYNRSPLFMPLQEEDPVQDLMDWMQRDNHHLWMALDGPEPKGYMRIQPSGESFISDHPSMMSITGAFVSEDFRGKGVGTQLLAEIQRWMSDHNYRLCGVDFESFNPFGRSFWNRYFTPYTFSMVRRIDERIVSPEPVT